MATMNQTIELEIIELHQFFQNWFNGVLPKDHASLRDFHLLWNMISP